MTLNRLTKERLDFVIGEILEKYTYPGEISKREANKALTSLFYELANEIIGADEEIPVSNDAVRPQSAKNQLRTQQRHHLNSILGGQDV